MSTSDEGLKHYPTEVCLALTGCHAGIHVALCRSMIAYGNKHSISGAILRDGV